MSFFSGLFGGHDEKRRESVSRPPGPYPASITGTPPHPPTHGAHGGFGPQSHHPPAASGYGVNAGAPPQPPAPQPKKEDGGFFNLPASVAAPPPPAPAASPSLFGDLAVKPDPRLRAGSASSTGPKSTLDNFVNGAAGMPSGGAPTGFG